MNKHRRRAILGLLLTASLGSLGCGVSSPPDGTLQCADKAPECPAGYVCSASDRTCWHKGALPDAAGSNADASVRADQGPGPSDAGLPDQSPRTDLMSPEFSLDLAQDQRAPLPDASEAPVGAEQDAYRDAPVAPDGPQVDAGKLDVPVSPSEVADAPGGAPETNPTCSGACCKDSDCPGPCQTCSASHTCVAVTGKDDPSGHCAGSCDATGACKGAVGQACVSGAACANGICSDGYCCDRTCDGTCEACNLVPGACKSLAAGATPHAGHGACTGTTPACAGTCDGTSGACAYPTGTCTAASCSGSTYQPAGTCTTGSCAIPASQACPSNQTCSGNACACQSPMLTCAGACIDPSSDPVNCGACGHSCLGGACASGQCQAAVVVNASGTSPSVFGLDGGDVYYWDSNGIYAYRVSKSATNLPPQTIIGTGGTFDGFASVIGGKLIKESRGDSGSMCDANDCPGTWTPLPTSPAGLDLPYAEFTSPSPTYLALYDTKTDSQGMTITWYSTGKVQQGTPYSEYVSPPQGAAWTSFWALGDNVYWIRQRFDASNTLVDTSVYMVGRSSQAATHLAGSLGTDMYIIDVSAQSILLVDSTSLYRIPLPVGLGSQAPQKLATLATASGGYYTLSGAEDASGVYWLDNDGSLYRCTPSPSTGACTGTKVLASGQAQTSRLFQDDTALYWGNGNTNQVMRLAK